MQLAVANPDSSLRPRCHFPGMGNDGECHALLPVQLVEQVKHAGPRRRIEIPGRFVGQQQQGIIGQRTGDRNSLTFAHGGPSL